jgi:2-iminobutanoate/2-iminopropanoate deaminase
MKRALMLIAVFCLCPLLTLNVEAKFNRKQRTARNKNNQAQSANPPRVEYLSAERARPVPFSDAVRVGHMLYLSGQVGVDENFKLVQGGIKAETKQVMENIRRVLERNGSSLDQVVKCTVMLADMSEWGAMNEVYVTFFPKDRLPARSALGVNGLAFGARVEIECIGIVK